MTDESMVVRRRKRPTDKKPVWWLQYRWDLLALLALLGGVMLMVGGGSFRTRLLAFLSVSAEATRGYLVRFDKVITAFVARLSIADVVGAVLVLLALVLIIARFRQRILRDPALTRVRCPRCGGALHRVHRTRGDRMVSRFVPVRRYACAASDCGWRGLRVASGPEPSH